MARTVSSAFHTFCTDYVDLLPSDVSNARRSRDWLLEQIRGFQDDDSFPMLHNPYNIHYGSFSRKTKIRPLDDIDLMIGLKGQGSFYIELVGRIEINVGEDSNLHAYCRENSITLNSIKIIEAFKSKLNAIPQYRNAEIKRNQEAVTLSLLSYDWVFDLVPCFKTKPDATGNYYFLIPDGAGNWKKTNPLIDRDNVSRINQQHNGKILKLIRLTKYWNKHTKVPNLSSYLIENLILKYYEPAWNIPTDFPSLEFANILENLQMAVLYDFQDPKNIQGNINLLSQDERQRVSNRLIQDHNSAILGQDYERVGRIEDALLQWRNIFGSEFPEYGQQSDRNTDS